MDVTRNLDFDFIIVTTKGFEEIQRVYATVAGVPWEKIITFDDALPYHKLHLFCVLANELRRKKTPGSVAEVGVQFGETARFMNLFNSDRTLYLFDTFKGFDENDISIDLAHGFIHRASADHFNMPIEVKSVLDKMFFPNRCIVRQGYVPDTFEGIDDVFSFVHIDCDLTKPIRDSFDFFWPRMASGGIVCIHDFYNYALLGVRHVVRELADTYSVPYLPDHAYGGAVFIKP